MLEAHAAVPQPFSTTSNSEQQTHNEQKIEESPAIVSANTLQQDPLHAYGPVSSTSSTSSPSNNHNNHSMQQNCLPAQLEWKDIVYTITKRSGFKKQTATIIQQQSGFAVPYVEFF